MHSKKSQALKVVTTVHGTYARDADWVKPDAPLADVLHERFGTGVIIRPFPNWSGNNNVSARTKAKDQLIEHLRELQNEYGENAQYFVVAHSHGGNVALYALRDANLSYPISGVACLATPFLVARQRILTRGKDTEVQVVFSFILLLSALAFFINMLISPPQSALLELGVYFAVLIPGLFLIIVIMSTWRNFVKKLLSELSLPTPSKEKLLIVRAPGDEASAFLLFFQFLSQVSVGIYRLLNRSLILLERWAQRISKRKRRVFLMLVVGCILNIVGFISVFALGEQFPVLMGVLAVSFICVFIGVPFFLLIGHPDWILAPLEVLIGATLFLLIIILSFLLLPFGWQHGLGNIFLDVTAETTPPGSWEVNLLDPLSNQKPKNPDDALPLQHSVHSDPRAHKLICEWMVCVDAIS